MTRWGVLMCGDRQWADPLIPRLVVEGLRNVIGCYTMIHGDAPGADRVCAAAAADVSGVDVEAYPAMWHDHGRAAGPIRNGQMVDRLVEFPEHLAFAFHDRLDGSKRTADMVRRLTGKGVAVYLIGGRGGPGSYGHPAGWVHQLTLDGLL